jgi:hypothetical protein
MDAVPRNMLKEKLRALSANSRTLHEPTAANNANKVNRLEGENFDLSAAYLAFETSEVANIKASLEELS